MHHRTLRALRRRPLARAAALFFLLAPLLLLAGGCTRRLADLSVVSSKNVDLYPLDLRGVTPQRDVTGRDGRWWFLFLPFGGAPNFEEALEEALREGGGDVMTSAVLSSRQWTFFFLVSRQELIIRGDVYSSAHARGQGYYEPDDDRGRRSRR